MCLGISVRCWIWCSNILTQFSVPGFMPICTRTLYCLRKQYFLILLTKQCAYLYRISCGIFLKLLLYFRKYLKLFWTILKMFRHFRTFQICYWFLFCRLAKPIYFVMNPNKNIWPKLLQYIIKTSRPNCSFCWNKMCLTLPLESFDDNKVLKIVNWIC